MLCRNKIFPIFGLRNSNTGAYNRPIIGHFLCPAQYGGSVLLSAGVSPHSPGKGFRSRKGTTAFYLVPTLKILAMRSNLPSAKCTPLAISAETILNDLLTTDEIARMRQHLRIMLDSYLLGEDDRRSREQVYGTYLAFDFMLCKSEYLVNERRTA